MNRTQVEHKSNTSQTTRVEHESNMSPTWVQHKSNTSPTQVKSNLSQSSTSQTQVKHESNLSQTWVKLKHKSNMSWTLYFLRRILIQILFLKAKVKQLMKGALPFKFAQNKIALVEKENETDYIAMQYLIENDWNLLVTKSIEGSQPWQLQQKLSGGQLRNLVGIRKVYYEKYAKNPKCQSWKCCFEIKLSINATYFFTCSRNLSHINLKLDFF